jgi:sulfur carrier protein ThiS
MAEAMQVQVKLYGTLGNRVAGYDHQAGLAVEVAEGATVAELIDQLGIPLKKVGMVSLDGRLARRTAVLRPGTRVKVFHPIFGG